MGAERGINPPRPDGDGGADLHSHTCASDGTRSPAAVVARAREVGLSAVAVTDHDTVVGLPEALAAGERWDIKVLPGVELSTRLRQGERGDIEVHVLGYGIKLDSPDIRVLLRELTANRRDRAAQMLQRLAALNLPIDPQRLEAIAGSGTIGRPHIARAMMEKGYANSIEDAFRRYLDRGGPAFVEAAKPGTLTAITTLRRAGAVSVLAHPGLLRVDIIGSGYLEQMKAAGMVGIEVYHSRHDGPTCRRWQKTADRLGLIGTGGSDCHGPLPGKMEQIGSIRVPTATVERLLTAVENGSFN